MTTEEEAMASPQRMTNPYSRGQDQLPVGESPPTRGPTPAAESRDAEDGDYVTTSQLNSDEWLLQKASEMYTYSTDYLESNITNYWERNLAHFNNEHAPGTPYNRTGFKRSRVFRPKTRANVKQSEAALANAAFSTLNLVDISPQDERNQRQVLSAAVNKVILEQRLKYRMPWFLTVQGAFQNTKVYGLCISYQYWDFHEDLDVVPALDGAGNPIKEPDPETGEMRAMGFEESQVRKDELGCRLMEPENFRFDPMCDWRDPATTSPYLVAMWPIYAGEAQEMMERVDPKTGKPRWRQYTLNEMMGTRRQDYDRTRQAREGRDRIDPADDQHGNEFMTLWAHMNIVKVDGVDYYYWTMGTELVLTEARKLEDDFPWLRTGERPFVVGYSTVEAHRNYPAGDVEQSATLQEEINTVANQRLDNVKLVLNKRHFVRRGSQVDLDALIRNTPGGGVMMNDPERDVQVVNTPDVTGSSYNEQGLLGQEMDELVGGFNPGQQQGNSVAGQQLGAATSGAVQDYSIKVFIETWMEPVLRQLQRLCAMYETDESLLSLAGEKAQAFERFGVNKMSDELMLEQLTVSVDVGMGNTDPMRKVERLVFGTTQVANLPNMAGRIKGQQVADAIYGAMGYRDSSQFIMTDQEFAEFQEANPPGPGEIEVKMRELDIREQDNQMRDQRERMKTDAEFRTRTEERMARQDMKLDELMTRMSDSKRRDKTTRDVAALTAQQRNRELNANQATQPTGSEGT